MKLDHAEKYHLSDADHTEECRPIDSDNTEEQRWAMAEHAEEQIRWMEIRDHTEAYCPMGTCHPEL